MSQGHHSAPVPRFVTLAAGIASATFGVPLLLLGVLGIVKTLNKPAPTNAVVIACIALVIGAFMSLLAYRLIGNRPRSDGGLMRVAGVGFIVVTPFYVWAKHSLMITWHAAGLVSAALACFSIASFRERTRD